jgi:dUTP pyrophosphatase
MKIDKIINDLRDKIIKVYDQNTDYGYDDLMSDLDNINVNEKTENLMINIDFVNNSNNEDPEFQTFGSSGFDLRANIDQPITISSGERILIPTGLFFDLPNNFEIQIRPRSGLAYKNGVTVLNSPGTIDSDYRGEIKVLLINLGKGDFVVKNGDRIAQGVISTINGKQIINLNKVKEISNETERGSGGFGSTGIE